MSTAAILAPRSLRAREACVITLTCVFTGLVPQITIRSETPISRGSTPAILPVPAAKPTRAMVAQIVRVEARIFLHMGEPIDAVAHHEAHRAGVVIGPYQFGAELALGLD